MILQHQDWSTSKWMHNLLTQACYLWMEVVHSHAVVWNDFSKNHAQWATKYFPSYNSCEASAVYA
jgi:hypothetical protein